jgi:hypothetical protein
MASEKDLACMAYIEDVKAAAFKEAAFKEAAFKEAAFKEAAFKEATASQMDIPSTDSEETIKCPDQDPPPDGGLCAWLQVLAGWILVLNSR